MVCSVADSGYAVISHVSQPATELGHPKEMFGKVSPWDCQNRDPKFNHM